MTVWMQTVGVSLACFGLGALARLAALPDSVDAEPTESVSELGIPEPAKGGVPGGAENSFETLFSGSVAERLPLMLRYVRDASVEELMVLDDRLKAEATGASRIQAETFLLCLRWLALDPANALAEARQRNILTYLYAVWGEVDLDAALAVMPESDRKRYLADVLQGCALTDPKRFADLFVKFGSLEDVVHNPPSFLEAIIAYRPDRLPELAALVIKEHDTKLSKVLRAWAKHDPEAAQDWAEGLYRLSDRKRALAWIYQERYEGDPQAGKERYDSLTSGITKQRVAAAVAKGLVDEDPEEAWSWALTLPSGDRIAALREMAKVVAPKDPIGFTQKLTNSGLTLHDIGGSHVLMEALRPHAKNDLAGTLALLSGVTDEISPHWLKEFAPELSQEALAETLLEMPSSQAKRDTMAALLKEWSKSDLSTALAFASGIEDPWVQRTCCLQLAANETQPEELMAWSQTLPDHLRDSVYTEAFARLAQSEPNSAYEAWQALGESKLKIEATRRLISSWRRNGKVSLELLQTLPIEEQPNYYSRVAYNYAHDDPKATSEWLATLPATNGRDRAIGSMIQAITHERFSGPDRDFEGAFGWAQVVSQEDRRADQLQRVVGMWRHKDERAARKAVDEASLNEGDRAILEKLFEK